MRHVKRSKKARKSRRTFPKRDRNEHQVDLYAPVAAFAKGSSLREAYRDWWHPSGGDLDKLLRSDQVISGWILSIGKVNPSRQKYFENLSKGRRKPRQKTRAPAKVRIVLDYPLYKQVTKIVTIDRRFPGEILGLAHDLYKEIYTADEAQGGKSSTENKSGPLKHNRTFGPLVWGHDIEDLVFESVMYHTLSKNKEGVEGEFTFGIGS